MNRDVIGAYEVSISKDELASLPTRKFDGDVVVVEDPDALREVVSELMEAPVVGFDTETKPAFKKGQINNVALIQLSTERKCFLIRLTKLGFPSIIKEYLENPDYLKVGLSIKDDFHNLSKLASFKPAGFIDLQEYVRKYLISDSSLTKIHSVVFGTRISKSQQLTNWEAPTLSVKQQEYAALDAMACVNLYNHLSSGKFRPETSIYYRCRETEE